MAEPVLMKTDRPHCWTCLLSRSCGTAADSSPYVSGLLFIWMPAAVWRSPTDLQWLFCLSHLHMLPLYLHLMRWKQTSAVFDSCRVKHCLCATGGRHSSPLIQQSDLWPIKGQEAGDTVTHWLTEAPATQHSSFALRRLDMLVSPSTPCCYSFPV